MISAIEKLLLYNQYELLKKLYPEEKDYYEDEQKTIEYGSDSDIEEMASGFRGTSEEVAEEVYKILHMFRDLSFSFSKYNPGEELPHSIRFLGFDGNEETEHYWYCNYLINYAHRYEEYLDVELNSHSNTLNRYRRMLQKYSEIMAEKTDNIMSTYLSLEQIERIAKA